MNLIKLKKHFASFAIFICMMSPSFLIAQTDNDAIMMNKTQWCTGATYMNSQWKNYWEGTLKRNNLEHWQCFYSVNNANDQLRHYR